MKTQHHPVLLDQVVAILHPKRGEVYLDGTAGFGGHAGAIADKLGKGAKLILVDRDSNATEALKERFGPEAKVIHQSFLDAADMLVEEGTRVDMILLDLGVSSPQIDNAIRGFSFRTDVPLDMRMDQSQPKSASDVVNHTPVRELERIIREYGEEPHARTVAQAIVAARPVDTTASLAEIVRRNAFRPKDIDPATKTFQAIRIAVNEELDQLREGLPRMTQLLNPGGRIAVISFHSLEDRIAKQFFEQESQDCICPPKQPVCTCGHVASLRKLTAKPITGDSTEIANNPRARSAKLRAAEKK